MRQSPYKHYSDDVLSLTDHLAIDRTVLALDRTLLAYLRTALALVAMGGTFLLFLQNKWTDGAGCAFIVLGGATIVVGVVQFLRMRRRLGSLGTTLEDDQHDTTGAADRGEC